jgi:molybdate transport system regulatory protein
MSSRKKVKADGVHGKIFINLGGETLLCRGRMQFLEALDESGSISAAARKVGCSYRKAWSLVERTNRAAGRTIIETFSGGRSGGGARLTEEGRRLLRFFRNILEENARITAEMWERFKEMFP